MPALGGTLYTRSCRTRFDSTKARSVRLHCPGVGELSAFWTFADHAVAFAEQLEGELEQYRGGQQSGGVNGAAAAAGSSATSPEQRTFPSLNLPRDVESYSPAGYHQRGPSSAGGFSNYSADTPASLAPPTNGLHSAASSSFYGQSPQDSSAFPLPPPAAQSDHQSPHLQSFPYTMNHAQQPQLSDLMNSPPDAAGQPFTPSPAGSTIPLPTVGSGQGSPYFAQPHPHPPPASSLGASLGFAGQYDRPGGLGDAPYGRLIEAQGWGESEGFGGVSTTWGAGLPPLDVMMDL